MEVTFRVCWPPPLELPLELPEVELPELVPELPVPLLELPEFMPPLELELEDVGVPFTSTVCPTWSLSLEVSPVNW
jgi:hypothetical protein